jgi:hypothetical protein
MISVAYSFMLGFACPSSLETINIRFGHSKMETCTGYLWCWRRWQLNDVSNLVHSISILITLPVASPLLKQIDKVYRVSSILPLPWSRNSEFDSRHRLSPVSIRAMAPVVRCPRMIPWWGLPATVLMFRALPFAATHSHVYTPATADRYAYWVYASTTAVQHWHRQRWRWQYRFARPQYQNTGDNDDATP